MSSLTAVQRAWDRITDAGPMHLLTKPQATRLVRASIARFDADQARVPAGFEGGGRFRSLADRLTALLQDWVKGEGPDDPLDQFDREQLRKTAKGLADKAKAAGDRDRAARLTPRRGASSDEIKLALYKDMRSRRDAPAGKPDAPKAPAKTARKSPVSVGDAQDIAEEIYVGKLDEQQILNRLDGMGVADLRKVATASSVKLPTRGSPDYKMTADEIRLRIAKSIVGDRGRDRHTPALPAKPGPAEKIRADVAEQVAYFASLIRDGVDAHDRETTPKLDRIANGLTDGSLSDADASDQLAALSDEYAGSASGDNLRNWSRALASPEQRARFRQAEIDKARGVAEVAAEVHELLGNGTDPDATRRSLRSIDQRHGVDTAHLQDLADDPEKLREAADKMARDAKLTRIGSVTEPVPFDRKHHEGIAGPLRDGQSVEVVRPGYSARLVDGEQVQISKARVEAAPAKAVKKAAPSKRTPSKRTPAKRTPAKRTPAKPEPSLRDLTDAELMAKAMAAGIDVEGTSRRSLMARLRARGITRSDLPDGESEEVDDDLLGDLRLAQDELSRAVDVTPGHDELHHYWTKGKGLARWVDSLKPWTTLVALLTEHVGPERAKVFASRWFIEVFGYAAGSDKNRVAHGKPPRGDRVGPG